MDQRGERLGERWAPAISYWYAKLEQWPQNLGEVRTFGVGGTGYNGVGLARFLTGRGLAVSEVKAACPMNSVPER
jgi:hypothetical protein